jgi:hypothetical protein
MHSPFREHSISVPHVANASVRDKRAKSSATATACDAVRMPRNGHFAQEITKVVRSGAVDIMSLQLVYSLCALLPPVKCGEEQSGEEAEADPPR